MLNKTILRYTGLIFLLVFFIFFSGKIILSIMQVREDFITYGNPSDVLTMLLLTLVGVIMIFASAFILSCLIYVVINGNLTGFFGGKTKCQKP